MVFILKIGVFWTVTNRYLGNDMDSGEVGS
jgi:hypothetical protein